MHGIRCKKNNISIQTQSKAIHKGKNINYFYLYELHMTQNNL